MDLVKELIIIDDGSGDTSADVAEAFAGKAAEITLIRQKNQGAHATINRAIGLSSGEFISILNSDDAYEAGRILALVRALDLDPGSDIASSSIVFIDGSSTAIENPWFTDAVTNFKKRRNLALSLIDANFLMTTSNFLIRRSLFEKVGLFAPLRYAHDLEFLLRSAAYGSRLAFIDKPLLKYRFHSSNTISENHSNVRLEWALSAAISMRLQASLERSRQTYEPNEYNHVLASHNLLGCTKVCLDYLDRMDLNFITDELVGDPTFRKEALGEA